MMENVKWNRKKKKTLGLDKKMIKFSPMREKLGRPWWHDQLLGHTTKETPQKSWSLYLLNHIYQGDFGPAFLYGIWNQPKMSMRIRIQWVLTVDLE